MSAVLLGPNDPPQKIQVGNYTLEVAYLKPRAARRRRNRSRPFPAAAIFIATGPDEYFAAGNGVTVTFTPNTPGPPLAGLATVEEGVLWMAAGFPGAGWPATTPPRPALVLPRLHVVADHPALFGPSFKGIVRVTLYRYR